MWHDQLGLVIVFLVSEVYLQNYTAQLVGFIIELLLDSRLLEKKEEIWYNDFLDGIQIIST